MIGVRERQAVDEPGQQRQGSRNKATGSYDQADEEDVLGVCQASVSLHRYLPVQAVILIAHAPGLSLARSVERFRRRGASLSRAPA